MSTSSSPHHSGDHRHASSRAPEAARHDDPHDIPPRLADLNLSMLARFVHCFLIFVAIFSVRAFYLQVINRDYLNELTEQRTAVVRRQGIRGNILDRNSQVLAQNVKTYRISVDPRPLELDDVEVLMRELPKMFPDLDTEKVRARLMNKKRSGALIWHHATYDQYQATKRLVKSLADTYVSGAESTRRIYPKGDLAGPLLGFVSIVKDHLSSAGRAGLEQSYEWALSGEDITYESQKNGLGRVLPVSGALNSQRSDGRSVMTTIDMRLQQITQAYLSEQIAEMDAERGVAVVMDPNNGDILAVAQVPSYDPNKYFEYPRGHHQNIFISSQSEPGSTMKPFLVAAALNEGVVGANTRFSGMRGFFKLGRFTIRDSHAVEEMSTLEIIKYSSNVGAIQLSQQLGKHQFYNYLKKFGFGESTQVRLYGELNGTVHDLKSWNPVNLGTMSYGYGLTVTPIQVVQALSVIANGGELIAPRVALAIKDESGGIEDEFPVRRIRRVISKRVAQQVTRGMMMVTQEGGTGLRARVAGYHVAGKTGTAHKAVDGVYTDDVIASFMGFAPAEQPRLAIYVSIDNPKKEKFGGKVAAPVFARIVSEALPFLGVPPDARITVSTRGGRSQKRNKRLKPYEAPLQVTMDHTPWWLKDRFLTRATEDMVVPDLRGLSLSEALDRLKPYGMQVKVTGSGVITSQRPESGELLPSHDQIEITLERPLVLSRPPSGATLLPTDLTSMESL